MQIVSQKIAKAILLINIVRKRLDRNGWFFSLNNSLMINCERPFLDFIAIAVYISGNFSVENFRVSLSATGEFLR